MSLSIAHKPLSTLLALACASLPVLAGTPESAPPSSAPTFSTPAVAPLSAPASTAPITKAPTGPGAAPAPMDAAATAKAAHALGYDQKQRDGKTVFCKKESPIGSHLQTTTCVTPEQVSAIVLRSQENKDSVSAMQRSELATQDRH